MKMGAKAAHELPSSRAPAAVVTHWNVEDIEPGAQNGRKRLGCRLQSPAEGLRDSRRLCFRAFPPGRAGHTHEEAVSCDHGNLVCPGGLSPVACCHAFGMHWLYCSPWQHRPQRRGTVIVAEPYQCDLQLSRSYVSKTSFYRQRVRAASEHLDRQQPRRTTEACSVACTSPHQQGRRPAIILFDTICYSRVQGPRQQHLRQARGRICDVYRRSRCSTPSGPDRLPG